MYMPLFEWDVAASLLDNEGDTRHPDYAEIEQHVTVVKIRCRENIPPFE